MIRMGSFLKRTLVMLLSVALISNSADMTVFAMGSDEEAMSEVENLNTDIGTCDGNEEVIRAEIFNTDSTADEVVVLEDIWMDLGDTYTTAPRSASTGISVFSLSNGTVDLVDTTAVNWIDRIDLSGDAAVIRTFYDTLVEATDNDGVNDYLIEDTYFAGDYDILVAEITGTATTEEGVSEAMRAELSRYSPYVRAAFDAFDRDHPEVFWLSGSTYSGASASYSGNATVGYTYTVTIKFMVKSSSIDIRDTNYQSQSAIKTAITARDNKVTALLNATSGMSTVEKIDYFNDQLTNTNEYNTSDDLDTIGHDCRECVSALEGRTGTNGPVCEAYARAFKVLCDNAGIPCVLVDGEAKNSASSEGEGHMWNYVQVADKWYGMDVTWNDPSTQNSVGAVSGYETDKWSLVGSETVPANATMKFIESHPVSNTASDGGVSFSNGPVIEEEKYVAETTKYGIEVASGTCSADGSSVNWAVYDSGADNDENTTTSDTLVISGSGAMADYESQNDRPWQSYTSSIVTVIVEDSVTTIGDYAFAYMGNVTSITIPDDITSIGDFAFTSMTKAEGLYIPSAVTTIGECAYTNCSKLTEVVIPSGVSAIAYYTFGCCDGLTSIVIPSTVAGIGEAAFEDCTNLAKVYISKRDTAITGTLGFSGQSDTTIYFESTPITEFEDVTLVSPYNISYKKNDVTTTITEVYADNLQSYTIQDGDLPATVGTWFVNNYNNTGRKYIEVGTVLDAISSDIVIDLIPMKITGQPQAAEVTYGYTTAPTLGVTVEKDGDAEVGYQWYQVYSNGVTAIDGANTSTMTLASELNVGTYTYTCAVTYGDYTIYSDEVTVTVNPTDLSDATVSVLGTYTYDGTEKVPATADVLVTWNGVTVPSEDYTVTEVSNNTNAGTAIVTITANADTNYTGSCTGTFTINPMSIEVADANFGTKMYDGTTSVEVTGVSFVKANAEVAVELTKDTDYSVTASYDDANAGTDKVITISVSLINDAATNYTLVTSEKSFDNQTINRANAPSVQPISKSYIYTRNQEVTILLDELLPEGNYGTTVYEVREMTTEFFEVIPSINDHTLSYTVKAGAVGDTGSITILVTAQNYEEIELTLNLTLIEQIPVELQEGSEVSLAGNTLTYGQALSELIFKEAVFVEEDTDTVVEGTLAWENPEQILSVGTHKVKWIFTPNDESCETLEGELEIIVEKANCDIDMSGTSDGYDVSYVYDGEHIPAPAVEQFSYSSADEGATIAFSWYRGDYVNGNMPLADEDRLSDTPINAGVYTLVLAIEATESYNAAEGRMLVEIAKKKVTVVVDNQERKYKENNPVFTFVVEEGALVGDDKVEDLNIVLSTEANVDSAVGTYPITGTATNNNYDVTITPATLTIVQADASIIVSAQKKEYKKTFGDLPFAIEATTNSDGIFTYTVMDGKDLEGESKAESDILTVSADGMVTINGSGTATVQIAVNETNNYKAAEPVTVSVRIERYDGYIVEPISDVVYTGKAIRPEPKVYDGESETLLVKGKDYTISYKYNVNASTEITDPAKLPTVIVKGKGSYTKQMTINFTILPKDIEDEDVTAPDIFLQTNGSVQKKIPTLTYNKKKLKNNKDMIVTYPDTGEGAYQADGEYTIHVEGQGNYTGERDVAITLKDKGYLINKVGIKKIPAQNFADYNGEVILDAETLVVTSKINGEKVVLEEGVDFEAYYTNNDKVGTATVTIVGINDYRGTKKATFKINGISIAKATVEGINDRVYNGQAFEPEVTVTLPTGEELIPDEDYTVDFPEKTSVGTVTVTIKGTGAYSGTIKKKFKITPYDFTGETNANGDVKEDTLLTEANGLLEMEDGELHAKFVKGGSKPEVELYFDGMVLTKGKDYTVSYKNNKAVTKTETTKLPMITIKGKGNFKGTITKIFTIDSKDLDDEVTFTVNDKAANGKAGGYISKPVLTDEDGKKLSAGKDYTNPVYTLDGVVLDKTSVVEVGKVITVTVSGMGNYTDKEITTTYRITELDFTKVKAASISKIYNGSEVELTEADFYKEDGTSKITLKDGTELKYGVDFEIVEDSYKKNNKKGTATVTLRGLGKYGGAKTIKFKIVSKELKR